MGETAEAVNRDYGLISVRTKNLSQKTMDDECPFDGELPAERAVARAPKVMPQSQSELDRIISAPLSSLGFKDFLQLKCGRDRFSTMKLAELKTSVPRSDCVIVSSDFPDDPKAEATCLRWMLRGLPVDKAVRKVKTDAEVAAKARPKLRR
jgi:ribonuclease HI